MDEPGAHLNGDLLVQQSEMKFSSSLDSLQQKLKLNKFEDFHCHCCHFSKNLITCLKPQDSSIFSFKRDLEVKSDRPETESFSLESLKVLNMQNSNSDSGEIDRSKLCLLIDDFSYEELNQKFQELNFALKMDFSTIENRLCFLCRVKNQAEINLEKEFQSFKLRIQNFQFLFESVNLCNKDRLSLISDLTRGMNYLENAVAQLTEIAMAYGYTHHEAEFLKFIFVMVENVKSIEKIKNKALKIAETFKATAESSVNMNNDVCPFRKRSFSVSSLESRLRRTELPEIPLPVLDYNKQNSSFGSGSDKSKDFSVDPITLSSDDSGSRKNISKTEVACSTEVAESPAFPPKCDADVSGSTSSSPSKEPFNNLTQSLTKEESLNVFFCLRKIFKWNVTLLNATQFRWPENPLQYASFYITWYTVFVLLLFFMGGLFTGFNGCLIFLRLQYSLYWLAAFTACILIRRFFRFLIHLFVVVSFALLMLSFLLTKLILPQLTDLETNALLKIFGLIFEVRYFNGPPPI